MSMWNVYVENIISDSINDTEYDYGMNDTDYEYEGELVLLCDEQRFNHITAACFITIFCLSVVGNTLLLCVLACFEDLTKVTNLFVLCLASFDLVFTLTLPFWAYYHMWHWVFGDVACKLLSGAYFVGLYGTIMLLTAMTVDRFVVVVLRRPWVTPRRRRVWARVACSSAWAISVAACLRDAWFSVVKEETDGFYTCEAASAHADRVGYYLQLVLLFLLPMAVIVFCYCGILRAVASAKKTRRTMALVLCIIVAFFACWGPYHLVVFLMSEYVQADCDGEARLNLAFVVCRVLAYSHCCVNPVLYTFTQKSRGLLCRLLRCSPAKRQVRKSLGLSTSNVLQQVAVTHGDNCETNQLKLSYVWN